jgi:hypothetical protein
MPLLPSEPVDESTAKTPTRELELEDQPKEKI